MADKKSDKIAELYELFNAENPGQLNMRLREKNLTYHVSENGDLFLLSSAPYHKDDSVFSEYWEYLHPSQRLYRLAYNHWITFSELDRMSFEDILSDVIYWDEFKIDISGNTFWHKEYDQSKVMRGCFLKNSMAFRYDLEHKDGDWPKLSDKRNYLAKIEKENITYALYRE